MESFSNYTILDRLGESDLGEQFRGRDTRFGRTVTLTLVSTTISGDREQREAFLADAATAATLSHPHIAALFDFGEADGRIYLAHEHVPGQSLQGYLTGRPLEVGLAIDLAVQLADALAESHRYGVVHGDIRPATVFVTPRDQTKIIEFGLNRWTAGGAGRRAVAGQLAAGREPSADLDAPLVAYMSPEQLIGGAVDVRTDIFSLGVVLYHMITGRAPFAGNSPGGTAVKILQCTPPPPTRQNPALPPGFDPIINRALAKSLDARYENASALATDLRVLAAELKVTVPADAIALPDVAAPTTVTRRRGRRLLVAAGVLAVLGGLAAAGWYGSDVFRPAPTRDRPVPRPVLAVAPFEMADGDLSRAYFGVGFAEDLAARLGEVQGLSVVGRSSIREAPTPPPAERAGRVGASLVLRGTIRSGAAALTIVAELVDTRTGQVIWSQTYAREPRQAAAAEAEVARGVAEQFRLPTPTGSRWAREQARKVDPAAYDLYLQARDSAERRDRAKAIALYRQAIEIDGTLIEARVGLSHALYLEDFYAGNKGDTGTVDRAREEAEAALAVDPNLPGAHLAAALSAPVPTAAATSLARALTLDPSSGVAWHHAGDLVISLDPARAIGYYRRSLALDPAIDASYRDLSAALETLGRLDEADQALAAGQAARPDRPWWTQMRARFEIIRQNYDQAVTLLATDVATESTPAAWLFGRVVPLKMASRTDEARKEAERLVARYPWFCEGRAVLAGLQTGVGGRRRAQDLVAPIYAQAASPEAPASILPCAAAAAAAVGDAAEAARYVSRLASDDKALRLWTRQAVFSLELSFRRGWYPWTNVAKSVPFERASTRLAASLTRLRDDMTKRLPAPPGASTPPGAPTPPGASTPPGAPTPSGTPAPPGR